MVKDLLMKKLLVLSLVFTVLTVQAQTVEDPVVMTVAGKQVLLSEFLFIGKKNGEVDLSDRKSVKEYVELFKNFKLKVAAAEEAGLDTTEAFQRELGGYGAQLKHSYFSDKAGEEAAVRVEYERYGEVLELSHLLFRLPLQTLSKDTLAVYQQAMHAYQQLKKGISLDELGEKLEKENERQVSFSYVPVFLPIMSMKAFEDVAYSTPVGAISLPVRTALGYHIIKIHSRKPNPGQVKVAQILVAFPEDSVATEEQIQEKTLEQARQIYEKAKNGADFGELARRYSDDKGTAGKEGMLPLFGVGKMVEPFEEAAFVLTTPGELSQPVKTRYGYHIIKLIEKRGIPTFEEMWKSWLQFMTQGERSFDYYKAFDERMMKEWKFEFYPEAYAELQAVCNDYFPTDSAFYHKAKDMKKTLFRLGDTDYPQNELVFYLQRCPYSTKTYAGDFLQEVCNLYIRDIVMTLEKDNFQSKHPEYDHLMKEYRDGILLFEISNEMVWSKPGDEQSMAEEVWIKSLNENYPVKINWKLLKKIKN